jgi:hypothetical protein
MAKKKVGCIALATAWLRMPFLCARTAAFGAPLFADLGHSLLCVSDRQGKVAGTA